MVKHDACICIEFCTPSKLGPLSNWACMPCQMPSGGSQQMKGPRYSVPPYGKVKDCHSGGTQAGPASRCPPAHGDRTSKCPYRYFSTLICAGPAGPGRARALGGVPGAGPDVHGPGPGPAAGAARRHAARPHVRHGRLQRAARAGWQFLGFRMAGAYSLLVARLAICMHSCQGPATETRWGRDVLLQHGGQLAKKND